METLQVIRITVHVDTDKSIYHKNFDNIEDAIKYFNEILEKIKGEQP